MEDHSAAETQLVASAYAQYAGFLGRIARGKFGVPEADAQALVHDIFLSYMRAVENVTEPRAWLIAAVCNACRHYWRSSRRNNPLTSEEENLPGATVSAEDIVRRVTMGRLLDTLGERQREAIRLHYFEGRSAKEVASILETTEGHAEKLLHTSLKKLRDAYARGD